MCFHPCWKCDRKGKSVGTLNLASHLALILMGEIRNIEGGRNYQSFTILLYYCLTIVPLICVFSFRTLFFLSSVLWGRELSVAIRKSRSSSALFLI